MMRIIAVIMILLSCTVLAFAQEHKIGPGDTLYIVVWGHDELSGPVPVSPDGTIALPLLGIVDVSGKTPKEASDFLSERLAEFIRNPEVTVSLQEFGYTVHIYGEVVQPGYYQIKDKTTLQEVIAKAGGLSPYADTRNIKITSYAEENAQQTTVVDFYKFLYENDESYNPFVKSDDMIFVPRLQTEEYLGKIVSVLGSVQKPGTFPIEGEHTLMDVIALAGGFSIDADLERVSIVNLKQDEYSVQIVDVRKYLQQNDASANPIVRPRMSVYVPSTRIPEELKYPVNVVGQVLRPGVYEVKAETARVLDAIFSAGGFAQGADMESVNLVSDEGRISKLNLKKYLTTGDMSQNPRLDEGDVIVVPVSPLAKQLTVVDTVFLPYKTVSVIGEVKNPGAFQIPEHASLLDLLIIAGGTSTTADLERVTLIRGSGKEENFEIDVKRILTEGELDLLPELKSDDTIFVPKERESLWRQIVGFARDFSTIAALVLILMGRR